MTCSRCGKKLRKGLIGLCDPCLDALSTEWLMQKPLEENLLKPNQAVSITIYDGDDLIKSESVYNYARAIAMAGELIPFPGADDMSIDILLVSITHSDVENSHSVIIEGILRENKKI